jgi:esterase/lipase/1-acyl-sn-glycerol-3-phosphate acyltransferase
MNRTAYLTTELAIKTLAKLIKARTVFHNQGNIPEGPSIFVINHFTRLETLLLPYYLYHLTKTTIWSLAADGLFKGGLKPYFDRVGVVSTKDPERDRLIIKTLLAGEAHWIIFPEGRMVKNKKIIEKGRYMVSYAGGKHPPHTGAAYLAMRAEFYRQRLLKLQHQIPEESERLLPKFNLTSVSEISDQGTFIVPVNITYYPLRARVNVLNKLAERFVDGLPERAVEELMTEGAMLFSGVDIDIRFGKPIEIAPYLEERSIQKDIQSSEPFDLDQPLSCVSCMRKVALKLTNRYMGAIYALTTVNHDHIFASLLKHSPINRIHMDDWRRRAFLAIARDAQQSKYHLHHGLNENQSHLLIDDRFGKIEDFISIAQEKKVVTRQFPYLLRNRRKLSSMFDFHRARIDNPIAVIANEVEPLVELHKQISRLCWLPGYWIRHRLARFLRNQAKQRFHHDYERYFLKGESKPKTIGRPILIKGRSRNLGIVLSHGYMAAPEEVRGLAEYLGRMGYWVYAPRLAGHGTSPEDLAQRNYAEWIESMEEGYLVIRTLCRHVVVGGFSTGAALALELATRLTDLAGVFAVSAPLRLQDLGSRFVPAVDTWNKLMNRVHLNDAKFEYVENHPENPHINYIRNPIAGVRQLERLMDFLEPKLDKITIPTLVVQSQKDPVVHPKGSKKIFNQIGSIDKQYAVFNIKRHGILIGEGSERVYRTIGDFIQHIPLGKDHMNKPAPVPAAHEESETS